MALFVKDTFTGTAATTLEAHTGETGATWTKDSTLSAGQLVISDANRIRGNTAGQAVLDNASGTPGSADYTVSAKLRFVTSVAGPYIGPVARSSGSFSFYMAVLEAGDINLLKFPSGTSLGSYAFTPAAGTDYLVALKVTGTTIKVYLDGVERISATDSSITAAGKAGVIAFDAVTNTTGIHMDAVAAGVPSFTASPSTLTPGSTGNSVTLTGIDTAWATLSASFALASSGSGAAITGTTINNDGSATLTIDAGTAGTITLTDRSTGETTTITVATGSTPFLKDTFTGTAGTNLEAHTGETGATWTKDGTFSAGQFVISDANRVRNNTAGVAVADRASGTPGSANYTVSAKIRPASVPVGPYIGPLARADGTGHFYASVIDNTGLTLMAFGSGTVIGSYAFSPVAGTNYLVALKVSGTTITVFLDGVQRISVTDSTLAAASKPGLLAFDASTNTTGFHVDGIAAGAPSFTPAPTSLSAGSTGNSVALTGTDTAWATLGASFALATSGVGAAITGTTINSDSSVTLLIDAGTAGTITLTDKSTGETATITVGAGGAASAVTMSGPTSGPNGVASSNFTVGANGSITGTVIVTPSDAGAGGTFAPTTVSINSGTPTGTFTYTPATLGAKTISATNNGGLANPTSITYMSYVGVSDANLFFSPGNWFVSGSVHATTPNIGAYLKTKFTGTSAKLNVDLAAAVAGGVSSGEYPSIAWSIDDGNWQTHLFASGETQITLGTALADATHTLLIVVTYVSPNFDQWVAPATGLKITGIELGASKATAAPALKSGRMAVMGDSISASVFTGVFGAANSTDGRRGWQTCVADAFACELGNWAFGGTGWISAYPTSGVPALSTTYDTIYSGHSRKVAGTYPIAYDYIFVNHGQNDGGLLASDVATRLTAIRAAAGGSTRIMLVIPFTQVNASIITSGFNSYQSATPDASCKLINLGAIPGLTGTAGSPNISGFDGVHPDWATSDRLGAMVAKQTQAAFGGSAAARYRANMRGNL